MQINLNTQIQQPKFKAVNKKYYDWAVRESKCGHAYGELLTILKFEVNWGKVLPQDGIDTVNAIKNNLAPESWYPGFERVVEYLKLFLK